MTIKSAKKRRSSPVQKRHVRKTRKQLLRIITLQQGRLVKAILAKKKQRAYYLGRIRKLRRQPVSPKSYSPMKVSPLKILPLSPWAVSPKTVSQIKVSPLKASPKEYMQQIQGTVLNVAPIKRAVPIQPIQSIPRIAFLKVDTPSEPKQLLYVTPPFKSPEQYPLISKYENLLLQPFRESTYLEFRESSK